MSTLPRRAALAAPAALAIVPALPAAAARQDARLLALLAEAKRADADYAACCDDEAGDAPLAAAFARWEAAAYAVADAPADGLAGVAVKSRFLLVALANGAAVADHAIAQSLAADPARLIPEAAPPSALPPAEAAPPAPLPASVVEGQAEGDRLRALGLHRPHGFTGGDVDLIAWLARRVAADMGEAVAARVLALAGAPLALAD